MIRGLIFLVLLLGAFSGLTQEIALGKPIKKSGSIRQVVQSTDGRYGALLRGSELVIQDLVSFRVLRTLNLPDWPVEVNLQEAGYHVLVRYQKWMGVYDVRNGKLVYTMAVEPGEKLLNAQFISHGRYLQVALECSPVQIIDCQGFNVLSYQSKPSVTYCNEYRPDASLFFSDDSMILHCTESSDNQRYTLEFIHLTAESPLWTETYSGAILWVRRIDDSLVLVQRVKDFDVLNAYSGVLVGQWTGVVRRLDLIKANTLEFVQWNGGVFRIDTETGGVRRLLEPWVEGRSNAIDQWIVSDSLVVMATNRSGQIRSYLKSKDSLVLLQELSLKGAVSDISNYIISGKVLNAGLEGIFEFNILGQQLRSERFGHSSQVLDHNARTGTLCTLLGDGTLVVTDIRAGKVKYSLTFDSSEVYSARFMDSSHLLIHSSNGLYKLHTASSQGNGGGMPNCLVNGSITADITQAAQGRLAFGTDSSAVFINLSKPAESTEWIIDTLREFLFPIEVVLSKSGRYALAHFNDSLLIYDLVQKRLAWKIAAKMGLDVGTEVHLDENEDRLFILDQFADGPDPWQPLNVYNLKRNMLVKTFDDGTYLGLAATPDGNHVVTENADGIGIIDPKMRMRGADIISNSISNGGPIWISDQGIAVNSEDGLAFLSIPEMRQQALFEADHGEEFTFADSAGVGAYWLTHSANSGNLIVFNKAANQELMTLSYLDNDPGKWIHLHPSGLFDASPQAMEQMYWINDMEVIAFEQLKDRYWLPGLWEKVMKGEELPDVRDIGKLRLQPEVVLGEIENGRIPITLKKRDGGYGKVSVAINGKEVASDARGDQVDTTLAEQTIYFSIADHPYLVNGENEISVSASSADGFVKGRGLSRKTNVKKQLVQPSFYSIVIGVSDYANDQIDLVYPEKDAEAISTAIKLGAENLFNVDKVTTYTISSSGETRPSKSNIKAVFDEIGTKAKAEDIVFVYLAGHGVTWGNGEESDFYFLTADATAANKEAYADPQIRASRTVSTNEIVEWLKDIAALKQVMIIDACGSGKAVENLIASRDVDASQIKAIDRMKDRTGMYVLSGCAADAVSYEASQYGQGLLTYSILEAMSGRQLKNGTNVDVFTIMDYARERVPELAKDIGGIQTPQLLMPSSGSFDIGILNREDQQKIPIASVKKVYVRSSMVNPANRFRDTEGLSAFLDEAIQKASENGQSTMVFFDVDEYKNSCQISGSYEVSETGFSADISVLCGEEEQLFKVNAATKQELVSKIVEKL